MDNKNKIDNQIKKRKYLEIDILSSGIEEEEKINSVQNKSFFLNNDYTNNSDSNTSINNNNSKNKSDTMVGFNKKFFLNFVNIIKNNIISFILLTTLLKIIVHFFIFPTEIIYINTSKKVYIQVDGTDRLILKRKNYHELERKYNKKGLIIIGDNVFYYPKEKERISIAKHIESTFSDRLWLFPCIFVLLVLLWIINNNEKNKDKLFSILFSKNRILIITFFIFLILLFSIYEKTEKIKELSQAAILDANIAVDIAEESLKTAKDASSEAEEASSIAEEASSMAEEVIYNYE